MQARYLAALFVSTLFVCTGAFAETTVQMNLVDKTGVGKSIGNVTIRETEYGLVFDPALTGLPAGLHGFHVHKNASCQPDKKEGEVKPAEAAGGHYDPDAHKKHDSPWGDGHLGDLPALYVKSGGQATHPVLAPRLKKIADLEGRTLMIHSGGDNYSDKPKPSGGGGERIACGVIQASK